MDKLRLYVWIALAAALYMCYFQWTVQYPDPVAPSAPPPTQTQSADAIPNLPSAANVDTPRQSVVQSTIAPVAPSIPTVTTSSAPKVSVSTDVFDLDISTLGGELIRADLIKYPVSKSESDKHVRLLDSTSEFVYVAKSGLIASNSQAAPTHQALFTTQATSFQLAEGQDILAVPLTWSDGSVTVTKTYTFKRGSYIIGLDYSIKNDSAQPWQAASYVQLYRKQPIIKSSMFNAESYAFVGPSIYNGKKKENLKLDKEASKNFGGSFTGGWMAAMQHHFVTAAVPKPDAAYDYTLKVESPQQFLSTYRGPLTIVAPGAVGEIHETLFIGPKIQSQLSSVGSSLEYTADYGLLTMVASPLFWLLDKVHSFIGNWGWSIILVTLLIKAAFYKLTATSGKSMAKMREVAPRLKAIQERYKDDREQLGRATMELYKKEKINPLNGCLPTLVQMPVWMAFYWVILNSAEMRQAPFIGYLTDLSTRDPYFILPILLGIANFAQFKLNPAPADPMQAKIMMMMPLVMTGMMAFFPAGLALYWITNTVLSIAQQWHINKTVAATAKTV